LIWEAESYTPTTYPGKALPSEGSRVFVIAMSNFVTADGTKIEDRNLSYEWVANFRPNRAASGVGKNVYVVDLPQGRAETDISVTVRENGGSLVASETLSIAPFAPRVLIYEEHPLLGTRYERALSDTYPLRSSEVTMRAEPYFLSGSISSFSYTWTLGGRFIPSFGRLGELLTLRLGDGSGTAPLSARATSASTQGGTNSKPLSIRFGSL